MDSRHFLGASALALAVGFSLGVTDAGAAAKASPVAAAPDPRDARIEALQSQLEALAAKVEMMERRTAFAPPTPAAALTPPPAPIQSLPPVASVPPSSAVASIVVGKPSIQSTDGRFAATFHGGMQFDAADYRQDPPGPITSDFRRGATPADTAHARDLASGTNFRRARIGVDGKAFGDFEYNVLLEYGGAGMEDAGHIQELWFQYSGLKPFHFRVGAFAPSIGLEDQGSVFGAPFLERPAAADIARGVAGGDFREAAMAWAAGERWYAAGSITGRTVGVVNSQATGAAQPYDSALAYVGRAAFLPLKDKDRLVHLGVHGSYVARTADTGGPDTAAGAVRYGVTLQERPELRVDGTRLISTGAIDADHVSTGGVEAAGQYKTLMIQAEYERIGIERRNPAAGVSDPHFDGWYVEGSWMLTGEKRRYNPNTFAFDAPSITHPFSPLTGAWGAFELAGRYSTVDLNYQPGALGTAPGASAVRGGEQTVVSGGVNWYLNSIVRFMLDYQDVKIDRLSPSATAYATPVGAQIGQRYQVISLRSQMAF
ncbi:hypothetical protein ASD21_07505 [Caulobacter sp. Root1455]|uniref:OprO/OprP family phosphate-selective porin n=1 Tax=Caulobacter sp. Root1455 TaxID=1736465 RepID=UPI0006F7218E|nr:porin [Caulobacter sp. Root1455]KQY95204.1 hypothetical protein ASD21_07505 [Caulobacter sp. Root1455]